MMMYEQKNKALAVVKNSTNFLDASISAETRTVTPMSESYTYRQNFLTLTLITAHKYSLRGHSRK